MRDRRLGDVLGSRRQVVDLQTQGDTMVAYKLVEVVFPYLGLQQRAEKLVSDSQVKIFLQVDKVMRENEATWRAMSDGEVDAILQASYDKLKGPASAAHAAHDGRKRCDWAQEGGQAEHRGEGRCWYDAGRQELDAGQRGKHQLADLTHEEVLAKYFAFFDGHDM